MEGVRPCAAMTPKDIDAPSGEGDLSGFRGTRGRGSPHSGDGIGGGSGGPGSRPSRAEPASPAPFPERKDGSGAIFERVSSLLEGGRYRDAEDLLSRGLEIYPESIDLLKELGVLYHLQGRYGKAARTFTRVMNITGERRPSLSWRIASLSMKARGELRGPHPELSLATFGEILALDPSDREALAGRIAALRALGRLEEARERLEEGLSLIPPGPSIPYQRGWLCMDEDRPDLASSAFEEASRADPSWPDPVLSRALALARLGRGAEGERLLREFAGTGKDAYGFRADLGWFTLSQHRPGEAKEIFLGLAQGEGDPGGFHGLAAVLLATGQPGEAGMIMERLSRAYPRDPFLQVNRAMLLARAGGARDLADATVAVKGLISSDPRFAAAHTCLGIIAFKEGKPERAEACFADAVRLSDPAGPRNLGLFACARGRWEEAEPHLLRAIRLDPLDARGWAGLGAVALMGGNPGEGLRHLRRACALDPWDTGAARGFAIALAGGGDLAGAEEEIRRSLGLAPGAGRWILLLDLAAILVAGGGADGNPVLDEEARQALGEAASLHPGEPRILFFEGVVAARLGEMTEAIDRFTACLGSEEYRVPALENVRRLKRRIRSRRGFLSGIPLARSALAVLALLQLAALWLFFGVKLISEAAFVLLLAILSGLFAFALLVPLRQGEPGREEPLELVIPERNFVPSPEAEMVSPLVRLRKTLRP